MARRTRQANNTQTSGRKTGRLFKRVFLIGLVVAALPAGYVCASFWQMVHDIPDIQALERYEPIEAIQLFDRNDKLICTVEGDEDRRVVPLSQISPQMQQAMLAAEDHHFYEHHGINPMSIVRASFTNLQAGHVKEGGSTITQQLIKNLFFEDQGRTFDRKVKEAFMSFEVERRYPKDKILEMYLNQVYFGNGGYGIERAASRYFDKTAATLTLPEAAFLAGLVKAPSELGNPANRKAALVRQNEILDKMVEYGYIMSDQAGKARKQKLVFKKGIDSLQKYPFYVSYVLEQLRGKFSEAEMRRQGLRVFTNLDPSVQDLAEKVLSEDIKKAPKGVTQGALVCVNVRDGAVTALVGGVGNFWKNQWNRATNPHTAGSAFKPFVYLTALLRHTYSPNSVIDDAPLTIKQGWGLPDWSPKNFDRRFMGKVTLRRALALSRNVPAVKVGKATGIEHVIETARQAGITTKLDPNLSLALGSSAVTPLDMAGAYSTFARAGVAIKPQVIRKIENNRGQIVESFETRAQKVFDTDATALLVEMLQEVVKSGTGTLARLDDRPCAGKTGTADAAKDIWFVGFTPDMVTALWGGNDDNMPIPGTNVTGGVVMAKIWKDFNKAYYASHPTPPGAFITPSSLVMDTVNSNQEGGEDGLSMPKLVPVQQGADGTVPDEGAPVPGTIPSGDGDPATPGTDNADGGAPTPGGPQPAPDSTGGTNPSMLPQLNSPQAYQPPTYTKAGILMAPATPATPMPRSLPSAYIPPISSTNTTPAMPAVAPVAAVARSTPPPMAPSRTSPFVPATAPARSTTIMFQPDLPEHKQRDPVKPYDPTPSSLHFKRFRHAGTSPTAADKGF